MTWTPVKVNIPKMRVADTIELQKQLQKPGDILIIQKIAATIGRTKTNINGHSTVNFSLFGYLNAYVGDVMRWNGIGTT